MNRPIAKILALHGAVLATLFLVQFALPDYHHTNVARIMVLAAYALGYNVLLGYTGLMSLGHAMFFAAGSTFSIRTGRSAPSGIWNGQTSRSM